MVRISEKYHSVIRLHALYCLFKSIFMKNTQNCDLFLKECQNWNKVIDSNIIDFL